MLPHRGESDRGKNHTEGGPCKTCSLREKQGKIDIGQKQGAVKPDVDQAQGHAVSCREITLIAGVAVQMPDSAKAPAVEQPSKKQAAGKKDQEEDIAEQVVGIAETGVDGIYGHGNSGLADSDCAVQKAVEEEGENSAGKTAVIEIVSLVPGSCTRKEGGGAEGNDEGKQDGQQDSPDCQGHSDDRKGISQCITE